MTRIEKKSERKKKAIMNLVQNGEYSIAYAMMEAERLNDGGKLLDNDYEELMEYLESLLEQVDTAENEQIEEPAEQTNDESEE